MSVAQQSFAEAIQHRLRRQWPKATIEYVGGGWFAYRSDPMLPSQKVRRTDLRSKADAIRTKDK
jgi:hypothetical protein